MEEPVTGCCCCCCCGGCCVAATRDSGEPRGEERGEAASFSDTAGLGEEDPDSSRPGGGLGMEDGSTLNGSIPNMAKSSPGGAAEDISADAGVGGGAGTDIDGGGTDMSGIGIPSAKLTIIGGIIPIGGGGIIEGGGAIRGRGGGGPEKGGSNALGGGGVGSNAPLGDGGGGDNNDCSCGGICEADCEAGDVGKGCVRPINGGGGARPSGKGISVV